MVLTAAFYRKLLSGKRKGRKSELYFYVNTVGLNGLHVQRKHHLFASGEAKEK